MSGRRVELVLIWHMHQPDYRDLGSGEFRLPWVYLHALKDYSDMAWHLEQHPGVRVTVNFVPVLLEQLDDYTRQFATGVLRDPLLRLLARPSATPLGAADRLLVLDRCFQANHEKMIEPFPAFQRMRTVAEQHESWERSTTDWLADQYFHDLVVWYHLAWTGETVRRGSQLAAALMAKGSGFSDDERRALLALIAEVVSGIVPRYRKLAEEGRIELSTTPQTHPMAPLLIDFACARESDPSVSLPQSAVYPGGRARSSEQIATAIASHAHHFGRPPAGIWPAEGGLSTELVAMLGRHGIAWTASGEGVLANSVRAARSALSDRAAHLYRPWRLPASPQVACLFRDDRLSDLIGFEYTRWNSNDAASAFVDHLEAIGQASPGDERPLVPVILDGENAWEFYPYNGWYFLSRLYSLLESHPSISTTTPSAWLADAARDASAPPPARFGELPRLVAGSWVHGNFSTWIGSADKNRAWDALCAAKQCFDLVVAGGRLGSEQRETAARQLAVCESSDWFWWFGDYNPARAVQSFDSLFRANLAELYRLIGLAPPASLDEPVSRGAATAVYEGAMRRAG